MQTLLINAFTILLLVYFSERSGFVLFEVTSLDALVLLGFRGWCIVTELEEITLSRIPMQIKSYYKQY
jgi:hypothetical protein